jgi:hypothetical protein
MAGFDKLTALGEENQEPFVTLLRCTILKTHLP